MKAMEDLFREVIRQDLLEEFNRGMEKGLPQDKIDSNIRFLKRQLEEKYGIPFSKANGGEIFTTGSQEEKDFITELEGRDFTKEMQEEQALRERERRMLEDQEREFLNRTPMFELNTMEFDGREVPVIEFKDGENLSFPEIEGLFRTYKTAPETNLGPETTRQILQFLEKNNPTKEQFIKHFFLSRRLAEGGEVTEGIGSLSSVARNMNNGGEADSKSTVFANKLIDAAVNAKGVRREAKEKFVEGDYAAGISEYLMGVGASLPVYKQIYAGIGQALINADEQGDNSFTNVLKNLLNPQNTISFIKQKMNFSKGGEVEQEVENIIPAVIMAESSNNPKAVSEDGAIGLMQILPQTAMRPGYGVPNIFEIARAQGFDVQDESLEMAKKLLFSPDLNVEFGSQYLKAMRRNFDTMEDALRAYNAGPGNFNKYLAGGRDLSLLDQEAIDYPTKVAAANQGVNPNEPAEFARFSDSPEAFSAFMTSASEERPERVTRPKLRPMASETLFAAPVPPQRPEDPSRQQQQKEAIEQTVREVVNEKQPLQEKYSPEGIEQMLIGTIGESLLPRLFQRGSPYSSRP